MRIIPRVERGEFINAGVILFVRASGTLCALIELPNPKRIRQLDPDADIDSISAHLALFSAVCDGSPDAGPIGELPVDERFHWLTAPRSTIIQVSPVHEGKTSDPERTLKELFERYVARS